MQLRIKLKLSLLIGCYAVAQLVEALRHKPVDREFGPHWATEIFQILNLSGLLVALESKQPLTERAPGMSSGGNSDRCVGIEIVGTSTFWSTEGLCRPV
jgi:hypothetical protein